MLNTLFKNYNNSDSYFSVHCTSTLFVDMHYHHEIAFEFESTVLCTVVVIYDDLLQQHNASYSMLCLALDISALCIRVSGQ